MAKNPSERPPTAVFRAIHVISDDFPYGRLLRQQESLAKIDGLRTRINDLEMTIFAFVEDTYEPAPPGTHGFAQGFILAGNLLHVQAMLNTQLDWEHGEWKHNGFLPSKSSGSRFNITPEGRFIKLIPTSKED